MKHYACIIYLIADNIYTFFISSCNNQFKIELITTPCIAIEIEMQTNDISLKFSAEYFSKWYFRHRMMIKHVAYCFQVCVNITFQLWWITKCCGILVFCLLYTLLNSSNKSFMTFNMKICSQYEEVIPGNLLHSWSVVLLITFQHIVCGVVRGSEHQPNVLRHPKQKDPEEVKLNSTQFLKKSCLNVLNSTCSKCKIPCFGWVNRRFGDHCMDITVYPFYIIHIFNRDITVYLFSSCCQGI